LGFPETTLESLPPSIQHSSQICFRSKYFLKSYKANKHGVISEVHPRRPRPTPQVEVFYLAEEAAGRGKLRRRRRKLQRGMGTLKNEGAVAALLASCGE